MNLLRWTYSILCLFQGAYFALWMPKLQDRGFTLSQIALLFSVEIAISTGIDIPMGAVADRIGHRKVTLLGFTVLLIAVLIPTFLASAMALACGIVLIGVGNALISGAMDCWAADLQAIHHGNQNAEHFITRDQIQRIGVIAGSLGIPFIISFVLQESARGTWALFAAVAVCLLIVGSITPDTREVHPGTETPSGAFSSELKELAHKPGIPYLLAAWLLFGLATGAVDLSFYPRLTQEFKLTDSWIFGVIQASVSLSRLIGAQAWKQSRWVNDWRTPFISVLGSGVLFIAYGLVTSASMAVVLWGLRVAVLSAYFSTIVATVTSNLELKRYRATVLSISSVAVAGGEFILTSSFSAHPMTPSIVALIGGVLTVVSGAFLAKGLSTTRSAIRQFDFSSLS